MEDVVLISDPNSDPDDLVSFVLMADFIKNKQVSLKALIITLGNLETRIKRAKFAKGVFSCLGLDDIKVGVGCDYLGKDNYRFMNSNGYLEGDKIKVSYFEELGEDVYNDSQNLLLEIFKNAKDKSLTVVFCADTVDIAEFINSYENLFALKTKKIVIMGSVRNRGSIKYFVPDKNSFNIALCYEASLLIYRALHRMDIALYFVPRETVYDAPFKSVFYEGLKNSKNIVGKYLYDTRKIAVKHLWKMVVENTFAGKNVAWFLKTFTNFDEQKDSNKIAELIENEDVIDEIWNDRIHFYLYDPITILSLIDNDFMEHIRLIEKRDVFVAKIKDVAKLQNELINIIYDNL